jgi:EAL domain-containing protein (putative c-di-GMP-specific phosphodiesterase class I)
MRYSDLNLTEPKVFERYVQEAIARANGSLSVFLVDLTGVNKLFSRSSQAASEAFLSKVAKMLLRLCRDGDRICRVGDCTFGIVLESVDSPVVQQLAAEKVARLYKAALSELDVQFSVDIHIGIADYPACADNAADLIHNARIAVEAANSSGDPYRIFSPESHATMTMQWALQDDLAKAIENADLDLMYQPKISIKSGRPQGAEALLRWNHPKHGAIPPAVFIPIACDLGMIDTLTNFVLTRALRHAADWPGVGGRPHVSVNLEAQMLEQSGFDELIASSLSIWGDEKVELTVEITESALVVDSKSNFARLNNLRALGIGISVDDFGTGYSSLSYFKDIPATELKIDKSFISTMKDCDRNRTLVETIISLAHGFDLSVVAEGVETVEQYDLLVEMGCDTVQGFYFSGALPQEAFCRWLAEFEPGHAQIPDEEGCRGS